MQHIPGNAPIGDTDLTPWVFKYSCGCRGSVVGIDKSELRQLSRRECRECVDRRNASRKRKSVGTTIAVKRMYNNAPSIGRVIGADTRVTIGYRV